MKQGGFTLLEALVAMGLLAILLVGVLPTFSVLFAANTRNSERTGAVAVAQQVMEELRQAEIVELPASGSVGPQIVSIDERDYEVVRWFCLSEQFCGANSRHVMIEVNYGGRTVFTAESVYTQLR